MKPIRIREEAYKSDLEKYNKREELKAEIKQEFERILVDVKPNEEKLFSDVLGYFFESLELVYKKQNTLHLTGSKLAELLQLNIDNYRKLAFKYNNDYKTKLTQPNIEDYTDFAETEDEIKRLEYCERYIELIEDYEAEFEGRVFPREAVISHSPQCVFFNFRKNHFEPNIYFVKPTLIQRRSY